MIVLIAVTEKQVAVPDQFNTAPITGRQAIFNKVATVTEARLDVEAVGVYTTLELAGRARAAHAQTHPGCRYVQKVTTLDDGVPEPVEAACVKCGTITGGPSYCPPCQQAHWAEQRALDPELGSEPEPAVRATVGPQTVHLVTQ